jgi:hypothetical protein
MCARVFLWKRTLPSQLPSAVGVLGVARRCVDDPAGAEPDVPLLARRWDRDPVSPFGAQGLTSTEPKSPAVSCSEVTLRGPAVGAPGP